jgi:hypothetical protein
MRRISRADFGDKWPLTVEPGTLACSEIIVTGWTGPRLLAVTFETGSRSFPLNGVARSHKPGPNIDSITSPGEPIWVTDPITKEKVDVGPPLKNIGPLIDTGLKLCESN